MSNVSAAPPPPLRRARHGRWLGGVGAGVALRTGRPVGQVRLAFLLTALLFGLGALAYLACWLIIPGEGEDGLSAGPRGIVTIAKVCGTVIALGTLAVAAVVSVVFGYGWVVVALAAAILLGALASWPRTGAAWALLPVGALVLPPLVPAVADVSIDPRTERVTVAPRTFADLPAGGLRSQLNPLEVDLRHTALPRSGRVNLRVEAGIRRTVVALPHDRCVRVELRRRPTPLTSRVVRAALTGSAEPGAQLFGEPDDLRARTARRRGPTLVVDFASDGGDLVVRDYPDTVEPTEQPDWPGFVYDLESRPYLTGLPRPDARRELRAWRARRATQRRSQQRITRLRPGPCTRRKAER